MKKPRQLIIFAIVIVVLIAVSAGAAMWWSNYQISRTGTPTEEPADTTSGFEELPAEKTANEADELAYEGDVEAGVEKLDQAIANTTDKSEQFMYYSRKATLLMNSNDFNGALEAALKAYQLDANSESAALVAQIAEEMKKYQLATDYYQKAIDRVDKSSPHANEDTKYYKIKKTEMEAAR